MVNPVLVTVTVCVVLASVEGTIVCKDGICDQCVFLDCQQCSTDANGQIFCGTQTQPDPGPEKDVAVTPDITAQDLKSQAQYDVCCAQAPLALFPRLWRKDEDMIVAYYEGSASSDTNWVYLTADLDPGAEFSQVIRFQSWFQYLLKNRIWKHLRYVMPDGSKVNAVESLYLYDFGIQQATDENGVPLGYLHHFVYGVVIYAEDVGPVYCREQYGTTGPGDQMPGSLPVLRDRMVVLAE